MIATNEHRHAIPRLGLTGGIGSGKSTALAYLRELGAAVISSDDIVHKLYDRSDIVAAIRNRFGPAAIADEGVDRAAVARIVFADEVELNWLEEQLHPRVRRAIAEWAAEHERAQPQPALLAAEVPVLFEAEFAADFDFTLVITAPTATRRRRLSSKFSGADLTRRVSRQMPEEDKVARSDFAFDNSGSRRELREFLRETVAHILASDGSDDATRVEP